MLTKYLYILVFFTTWNLLFVIFHKYTYDKINLLYLSFITLICGLYISFINPKKFVFKFDNEKYIFDGWSKSVYVDIPFHIAIFLWVYFMYNNYYKKQRNDTLYISFLIFVFYICIINVSSVYYISFIEFLIVFTVAHLVYFAIF